ncbi:hypothetical protein RUND412_009603 [Rhizina undulata]
MTPTTFNLAPASSFSSKRPPPRQLFLSGRSNTLAPSEETEDTAPRTPSTSHLQEIAKNAARRATNQSAMDHYSNMNYQGSPASSTNNVRGHNGSHTRHSSIQNDRNKQQLPTPPAFSPALGLNGEMLDLDEMDLQDNAEMYKHLLAQNYMLAQQSAQLQQQLVNLAATTAAARQAQYQQQLQQQLQQLQLQTSSSGNFSTPPMSPGLGMSMYMNSQNLLANNVYSVYNQMTGQHQYYVQPQSATQSYQQQQPQQLQLQQQQPSPVVTVHVENPSPVTQQPPQLPSPPLSTSPPGGQSRSPPKPPRYNKLSHQRSNSSSNLPATPSTPTFAPGHASGSHPIRQPHGPPSIEELKAKPTSKDEGSKNFAFARSKRRRATRMVAAGMARRTARSVSGSAGGTMTPVSEAEGFAYEDGESVGSSASGRQSRQSRCGVESPPEYSASSVSGDEGGRLSTYYQKGANF